MGDKAEKFANAIKKPMKKIGETIKFMTTPLGHIFGWLLLIIVIVILFTVIANVAIDAIKKLFNIDTNYATFDKDVEYIKLLNVSGYSSMVDAENFQNFKSFEYAVLMDAANYIRNTKQEMFDVYNENEEYKFERETLKNRRSSEYNSKITELKERYANVDTTGESTSVPLMNVSYTTDQSKLSDTQLQKYIDNSPNVRNTDVTGIDASGTIRGGTNRVKGPYLIYEFKNSDVETTANNGENTNATEDESGEAGKVATSTSGEKYNSGEEGISLEPYVVIDKEKINYSYYFDENNKVIQYPLLLNAYNGMLNVGSENSAEINRALLGISPTVFPDEDVSKYTQTPYYSDKVTVTTYKIPLRVLIGRYLPKAELLNAWTYVKQKIDQEIGNTRSGDQDLIDNTIAAIKGIYNEACLNGESKVETIDATASGEENGQIVEKTYKYSFDKSNEKTFLTFEKAGIESTMYNLNGLEDIGSDDGDPNIRIVTDFISAVTVDDSISFELELTSTSEPTETTQNTGAGTTTIPVTATPIVTTTKEQVSISLDDLKPYFKTIKQGHYIPGDGDETNGYYPPSSLEGVDGYYVKGSKNVDTVLAELKDAVNKYLTAKKAKNGETITLNNFPDDVVQYTPVFIANKSVKVAKKVRIDQVRMPILLIKSANTWCRKVTFNHEIVQNQFKQNNAKYIVPKSVSSLGLSSFNTTVVNDNNNGYRGKAYSELFSRLQEKDATNMLLYFETAGNSGMNDSFEFMRDFYKLIKASQDYSVKNNFSKGSNRYIHPDTFKYVHIPESVLYYDDSQSQKIYWLNMLAANEKDPITEEEMKTIKTKDKDLSWQLVEYEKYPECNNNGTIKVYALHPFGSAYVRSYYSTMKNKGKDVSGSYKPPAHNGADWSGRSIVTEMLEKQSSATSTDNIESAMYKYVFESIANVNGQDKATEKLKEALEEEKDNMPIVAVAPGVVESVSYGSRSGFKVTIKHSDTENVTTSYMHMKRWPLVNKGDFVGAGTVLGYEGSTGRSSGNHLHFEVSHDSPEKVIFPVFNPFYNEEKAQEVNYDLTSDYMSLYRTVNMLGNGANYVSEIENQVPEVPLVNDVTNLIQKQGSMENRSYTYSGELDWGNGNYSTSSGSTAMGDTITNGNSVTFAELSFDEDYEIKKEYTAYMAGTSSSDTNDSDVEKYDKYLEGKNIYDLYLNKAYFDRDLAMKEGFLENPALGDILAGDIIVNPTMPGGLPALTKEELKTMLNGWLNSRYSSDRVKRLMSTIFTDANINTMLASEKKYNVSVIFAIAVATIECNISLANTRLCLPPAYNIFSIKGGRNGGIRYQGGKLWNKYHGYGDAFDGFMELIAESSHYYKAGKYTVKSIAPTYCNAEWGESVTNIILQMMKYYPGTWSPPTMAGPGFSANSKEIIEIAKNCMKFYVDNNFAYCQAGGAGRLIPPYDSSGKVRQKKHSCSSCKGLAYRADCSTYVSWVIYEFAKAHGYSDLQKEFSRQHTSYEFQAIGQKLKSGAKSGFYKYFELVQYGIPGKNFGKISNKIQAGDILVYRDGGHHVEIAAGNGTGVYTYGTTQRSVNTNSKYTRRSDATCVIRLKAIN